MCNDYSERQAQHLIDPFVADAEILAPMFNQTLEEYLGNRLAGFNLTTPGMAELTEADIDDRSGPLPEGSGANELLAALHDRRGNTLFQPVVDQDGNAAAPGETNPKIAKVVEIDPAKIVDADGKPIDLKNTAALRRWVKKQYEGTTVRFPPSGRVPAIQ